MTSVEEIDVVIVTEKKNMAVVAYNALSIGGEFKQHRFGYYGKWMGKTVYIGYTQGHIYGLLEPDDIKPEYKKWDLQHLPFPIVNQFKVVEGKHDLEAHLRSQIQKCKMLVLSTDPDEQGVYIGELVRQMTGFKGPVKRVGLKTTDPDRCREQFDMPFEELPEYKPFIKVAQSEACRSRLDYDIGMNLSRLYILTAQAMGQKADANLVVGRVQTPILTILVNRYLERKNFVPEKFFTFLLRIKSEYNQKIEFEVITDRVYTVEEKKSIAQHLSNFPIEITDTNVKKVTTSGLDPYKQDSLQIEMGKKYGYDALAVLAAANANYQKGYQSYPRTDGDKVEFSEWEKAAEAMPNVVNSINNHIETKISLEKLDFSKKGRKVIPKGTVADEAHTAILPTGKIWNGPYEGIEWDVYKEVVIRYLMMFMPENIIEKTSIIGMCGDYQIKASGDITIQKGWKEYQANQEKDKEIPVIKKGTISNKDVVVKNSSTKIPPRYQSHDIISELKNIGKHLPESHVHLSQYYDKDENAGLGSSATKGPAIAQVLKHGLIHKIKEGKKEYLEPTKTGIAFHNALPVELKNITLFATWEKDFRMILTGEKKYSQVLEQNHSYVENIVNTTKLNPETFVFKAPTKITGIECPECFDPIEKLKSKFGDYFKCEKCKKSFPSHLGMPLPDLPGHGDKCDAVHDGELCTGTMKSIAGIGNKGKGKPYKAIRCTSKACKNIKFIN